MFRPHRLAPIPLDEEQLGHELFLASGVVEAVNARLPKRVSGIWHENVLYFAGRRFGQRSIALAVIQPLARTSPGSFRTDLAGNDAATSQIRTAGLELIGQIHCHPGTVVEHSDGDDEDAVLRYEGFWSLVVPHYGRGYRWPEDVGVHCYRDGSFRLLTSVAVAPRVHVVPAILPS